MDGFPRSKELCYPLLVLTQVRGINLGTNLLCKQAQSTQEAVGSSTSKAPGYSVLVTQQRDLLALSINQLSNQPRLVSLLANYVKGRDGNFHEVQGGSSMDSDSGNFYFDGGRFLTRKRGAVFNTQTLCLIVDILLTPLGILLIVSWTKTIQDLVAGRTPILTIPTIS